MAPTPAGTPPPRRRTPSPAGRWPSLAEAQPQDVDAAVDAARAALADPAWAAIRPRERAQLLFRLADAIEARLEEFAALEAVDSGKPLRNARNTDIPQAVDHLRYFAGWATKIEGATITSNVGDYLIYTRREPVGVCGLIVPWNYPLLLTMWKLAPALACGNAVILKPAEQTSLTALRLAELACELGLPARRDQRADRPRRSHRGRARRPPGGGQDLVHRLDRGRQVHRRRRRRQPDPRLAGTRRQVAERRVRRRRPGGGRVRRGLGDLLQHGRGLLRRVAAVHPGAGLRRVPGRR